jgi:hypothetical protein
MSAMMVEMGPEVEISRYRPSGGKFETVTSLDREWTSGTISGPVTYTEVIYPLSSILKKVTPTGAGAAKTWSFSPAQTAADTIATYTIEVGSAARAQLLTYGLFTEFGMSFSTQGSEISGALIGKAIQDNITMTATPTALSLLPVNAQEVSVKVADTQAGLTGASALTRVVSASWNIANRFGPVWVLGSSSFAAHVELPIEGTVTLRQQADAAGWAFLTTMRDSATKFIRITAVSPLEIEPGDNYVIQIDSACRVVDVSSVEDEDGVAVIEWTAGIVWDSTWTKATEVLVTNALTAL